MSTFDRLRDAMAATLKVPPDTITDTTKDKDVAAWDSLGHVNLMMTLEQTFGVFLEVEDFATLNSVPAILGYLRGQGIE